MTSISMPEGVDWDLEEQTDREINAFHFDHYGKYLIGQPARVVDFVIIGGIPIDHVINWCKAHFFDDQTISELEALKATLSKSQEV